MKRSLDVVASIEDADAKRICLGKWQTKTTTANADLVGQVAEALNEFSGYGVGF